MKVIKLILIFCSFIFVSAISAQQEAIAYQTILQDRNGDRLIALDTEVEVILRENSNTGNIVYTELHNSRTGLNGELELNIGTGQPETIEFSEVDWTKPIFVELKYRPSIFNNFFSNLGSELLAVPYAIFSLRTRCDLGCPGEDGIDGIPGPDGPRGPEGPQGWSGQTGQTGATGVMGTPGMIALVPVDAPPATTPVENFIYLDDGTNRTDASIGYRQLINGQWIDL